MHPGDPVDRGHWDEASLREGEVGVSWFEETPTISLDLIKVLQGPKDPLIDVGSGASRLAAHALQLRFSHAAVLDPSTEAIAQSQTTIISDADRKKLFVGDVTTREPEWRNDGWLDLTDFLTGQRFGPATRAEALGIAVQTSANLRVSLHTPKRERRRNLGMRDPACAA